MISSYFSVETAVTYKTEFIVYILYANFHKVFENTEIVIMLDVQTLQYCCNKIVKLFFIMNMLSIMSSLHLQIKQSIQNSFSK